MSQPASDPLEIANLVAPTLDGIIRALSDRPDRTAAERQTKATQALTQILAFLPRDVSEMTRAGQTALFNEVIADSARDVLRGMNETTKQRAISSLVSMGRLVQGNLDRLDKRGNQPHRTESATPREKTRGRPVETVPEPAQPPRPAATKPAAPRTVTPRSAETPAEAAALEEPYPAPWRQQETDTSWLDEPYVQWLIETPADLARKEGKLPATEPSGPDDNAGARLADPSRRDAPRARVLADAAAGD